MPKTNGHKIEILLFQYVMCVEGAWRVVGRGGGGGEGEEVVGGCWSKMEK